jgi:hypothetical protein
MIFLRIEAVINLILLLQDLKFWLYYFDFNFLVLEKVIIVDIKVNFFFTINLSY